ncbi:DUF2293 domain-containing protein [bacterium]|nr:DUF2293 domain-containing protein [bacterium]MDB4640379.1 DUF2293 domain-containing protein [Pirellulaceae bacterium]
MPSESRIVSPGPAERTVYLDGGAVLQVPEDWELLSPGDAGLTRRVKSRGPTWTVKQQKGRRTFSLGVWAPADRIIEVRKELEQERSTEKYAKSKVAAAKRRESKQAAYVEDFHGAVVAFLNFEKRYVKLANRLAEAVTKHATPVGSGTVARTERIPIERRAESAVIAWMRHQTTAYDRMAIPRAKGMRREVRRMLAEQSRLLLRDYRSGKAIDAEKCPLQKSLSESSRD